MDLKLGSLFFYNPMWLLLLPLSLLPWVVERRRRQFVLLASVPLMLHGKVSDKSPAKSQLGWLLRGLSIFLLIISLARPQIGTSPQSRSRDGVDIMLAIDTSGSMRARDFEIRGQRPDRLEVIKSVIENFISERPDDRIGMVVFGSQAYTQAPLTLDHDVLREFLRQIEIGMAGDGTAIGDGLATAVKRLRDTPSKSRVIILLTDGANNSGRIDPMAAADAAKTLGMRVHTIGVGSEGVVPIVQNGRTFHIQADIDERTLKSIADTTRGQYWRATDTKALVGVYREIDKLEKVKHEQKQKKLGNDLFPHILLVCLALYLLELIWRSGHSRRVPA